MSKLGNYHEILDNEILNTAYRGQYAIMDEDLWNEIIFSSVKLEYKMKLLKRLKQQSNKFSRQTLLIEFIKERKKC